MAKKGKQRRRAAFFRDHPFCCFCGGGTPATTIDHVPSRMMFLGRRRPQGLEFPACRPCNQATKGYEQVAAMLARMFPDSEGPVAKKEVRKLMNAVNRSHPGIIEEMLPSWRQQYDFEKSGLASTGTMHAMNANGPILNRAVQVFGAKLCIALHYEVTGSPVPLSGGIAVRWFTNYERLSGGVPDEFLDQLRATRSTLRQGKWGVPDQFEYAWIIASDAPMSAYFATFRFSFAVAGFIYHDAMHFPPFVTSPIHRPGSWLHREPTSGAVGSAPVLR